MGKLIVGRLAAAVPLLLALSALMFLLLQLIPGSAAGIMLGESATAENIAVLEAKLGLNDPLPQQYIRWLADVSKGDFGNSLFTGHPVWKTVQERLPPTISISFGALLFALIFGLSLGVLAGSSTGLHSGSNNDSRRNHRHFRTLFLGGRRLFSIYFSVKLGWFPAIGYVPIEESLFEWARCLVLPCIALGITSSAVIARQMRGALVEVLQSDYIRAARATGVPERRVLFKHGFKNAMIPVMTIIGFQIPVILGGAFVIEIVFAIPGLGSLTINSVLDQDIPVVQCVVLLTGFIIVLTNLFVDISYSWLNPKVRVS